MGHALDPWLDGIKHFYSRSVQEAHEGGFEEGATYVEHLIKKYAASDHGLPPEVFDELLDFVRSRPVLR